MRSSDVAFHILNSASDFFFLPHKPAHGGNVAPPGLADSAPLPARLQTSGTLSAEGSSETTRRKCLSGFQTVKPPMGFRTCICALIAAISLPQDRNADTATQRAAFWQSKQHAFLRSLSPSVQTGSFRPHGGLVCCHSTSLMRCLTGLCPPPTPQTLSRRRISLFMRSSTAARSKATLQKQIHTHTTG